jgi:chromate transporter
MTLPASESATLLPKTLEPPPWQQRASFSAFLSSFLPLGFLSFGGPTAHIALLHDKYVSCQPGPDVPRLSDASFVELFALASALPGPSSTQLATSIGATFGGLFGAIVAFFLWQLPGALALTAAGVWFHSHLQSAAAVDSVSAISDYAIGLISAAFAMVCIAAVKITASTCAKSNLKMALCILSASVAVLIPPAAASWVFGTLLFVSGCAVLMQDRIYTSNRAVLSESTAPADDHDTALDEWDCNISPRTGVGMLAVFIVITSVIMIWKPVSLEGEVIKTLWRIGATVFGGGQVVIPFLLTVVIETRWIPLPVFLSGFGLVGALPGPMFNLCFFLTAALFSWRGVFIGATLFLPGIILLIAALPFWAYVRQWKPFRTFLSGVTAGATGLIVAGVWMLLSHALVGPLAFSISIAAAAASVTYKVPTPYVIASCGVVGALAVHAGIGGPYH